MVHPRTLDRKGRYVLREMRHGDYSRLRQMNVDLFFAPLRHQFGPVGFLQAALKQQKERNRSAYFMGVADARDDHLIGGIMVFNKKPVGDGTNQVEIGYFIDPSYQRIHFATDATVELLGKLKQQLKISKVMATVDPGNIASRKILDRLGFKHVRTLRASKYKANPDLPESWDEQGKLKQAPRDVKVVGIEALFAAAKQVTQPDPARVTETISAARTEHYQAQVRREQVRLNLQRYLRRLNP